MRYRDLETGVFLTRDPIGYGDGPNVYCYVHCNPITSFDALGLSDTSESEAYRQALEDAARAQEAAERAQEQAQKAQDEADQAQKAADEAAKNGPTIEAAKKADEARAANEAAQNAKATALSASQWADRKKWIINNIQDGDHLAELYAKDFGNDRPRVQDMSDWSMGLTSENNKRDIMGSDMLYRYKGKIYRGDQLGNIQAGYGIAYVLGSEKAWDVCIGAEVSFSIRYRPAGSNFVRDAAGSFEMNNIGIRDGQRDRDRDRGIKRPTQSMILPITTGFPLPTRFMY